MIVMFRQRKPHVRGFAAIAMLASLALPGPASAGDAELLASIRAADLRLASIGYRLATTNAALCDRQEPGTGMVLHTPDQYAPALRDAVRGYFGFETPVAVEAVIAGSPAAQAGIRPNDALRRVGAATLPLDAVRGDAGTERLIAATDAVAQHPAGGALVVEGVRGGAAQSWTVHAVPACRTRFELQIGRDFGARADGEMVQISVRFLEEYKDEDIAAVVAHELSHNILRHRARLKERGVDFGMLSGFGGNVKYFRQVEIEADLLGVYLLANAGYDPMVAVRFWKRFGPERAGGILRSRSHPEWRDRVATIEAEAMRVARYSQRPVRPALLERRNLPVDGDWQALLQRSGK